jgi:hypothetical protein
VADEVQFHPPSLRGAGQELAAAAGRLQQEWQALLGAVRGMGEMFGDDMVSSLIGTSYQIAQEMAEESYTSAIQELRGIGDGLVVMAEVYDRTEQGITTGIDRLRGAM